MHVLILDLTHGGDILSEEYVRRGETVTCVDVYCIATKEKKDSLASIGVDVRDEVPKGHYDLLVSPAHCPDMFLDGSTYDSRKTFSQAVHDMMGDGTAYRIEITGVKGKTSTCYLLAHLLHTAGRSVFLHTSRGQGQWTDAGHAIEGAMSIAPTSLLRIYDRPYDCIIAEVSLGGSGKADIAAITNLAEDYGIAKNTRKASDAKADILTDKINIVKEEELALWSSYGERRFVTYGDSVKVISTPKLGEYLKIRFVYNNVQHTVPLSNSFLSLQYIPSIELALKICEVMGIPTWAIINGLKTFEGVPGRGEISKENGIWTVKDRNPGISHISIGLTLNCLKDMGELNSAVVIVDPVSKKVCDKMDSDAMRSVADSFGVGMLFTDGKGSDPEIPKDARVIVRFIKEGYQ